MHLPASLLQSLPAWTFTFLRSCLLLMPLCAGVVLASCLYLPFLHWCCVLCDSGGRPNHLPFLHSCCVLCDSGGRFPICEVHLATNWWHHLTPGSTIFAPKLHFLATTLPQCHNLLLISLPRCHNPTSYFLITLPHCHIKSIKKIVPCSRLLTCLLFPKNYQEAKL